MMPMVGGGIMNFESLLKLIVDNGTSLALLVYFIYKDNKFTENLTKSLTAIQDSLEILKDRVVNRKDD